RGLDFCFAHSAFRQREKRLVIGFQRVSAECLERLTELRFGVLVRLQALSMDRPTVFELRSEARLFEAGGPPADKDTQDHANTQRDDADYRGDGTERIDGH